MKNKVVINKASSPKSLSPSVFIGDPIGDLQRSVILETATTTTHVEDSRQKHSGITTLFNCTAFTLIELLVVVLIIGILAAVAVPQYQVAVAKSRFAKLQALVSSVVTAQEVYFLANGQYAVHIDELTVDLPAGGTIKTISDDSVTSEWIEYPGDKTLFINYYKRVQARDRNVGFIMYFGSHSRVCTGRDAVGYKVCESLGGKFLLTSGTSSREYKLP